MARVCSVTGKKPQSGNNVSHAHNKTRRRFVPNMQVCSFPSEILGKALQFRITPNGIRTIEHKGGVDAWLMNTRNSRLGEEALKAKKLLLRAQLRYEKAGTPKMAPAKISRKTTKAPVKTAAKA